MHCTLMPFFNFQLTTYNSTIVVRLSARGIDTDAGGDPALPIANKDIPAVTGQGKIKVVAIGIPCCYNLAVSLQDQRIGPVIARTKVSGYHAGTKAAV